MFLAIAVDNLSTDGDEEEGGGDEPAVDAADIVLGTGIVAGKWPIVLLLWIFRSKMVCYATAR